MRFKQQKLKKNPHQSSYRHETTQTDVLAISPLQLGDNGPTAHRILVENTECRVGLKLGLMKLFFKGEVSLIFRPAGSTLEPITPAVTDKGGTGPEEDVILCMVTHLARRVWISRVRLPLLHVVSSTGKIHISLSAFTPENLVSGGFRDQAGLLLNAWKKTETKNRLHRRF